MASPERQSLQKFSPGIPRPSGVCLLQAGHPPPESGGLAHSPAGDDCIALPVASEAFCPESHRFPLVVATTTENHLHYDTTQNSHSAGCDPHSRNDLPELPDITCLVPRPWSATLREPHSTCNCPRQGLLFRSAVCEKAHIVTPQLDNSPTSFVSRNVADCKRPGSGRHFWRRTGLIVTRVIAIDDFDGVNTDKADSG